MLWAVQEVVKNKDAVPGIFQWAQFVAVPVVIAAITTFGVKINNRMKSAEKNSAEAAASVRPNGSGHSSQTAMIEDVLMLLGEIRGDIKDIDSDVHRIEKELRDHVSSPGHSEGLNALAKVEALAVELKELLNIILHLDGDGR